jgi:iron complex outermembrane receptor protein
MRRFTSIALSTVSFGALALAVASPAAAQDTATPDTSTDCAVIVDEAAKQACLEKVDSADPLAQEGQADTIPSDVTPAATEGPGQGTIVVTGSRIRRSEFTSPDPIQIINPELGRQEGKFQTVELINSSPIAAGSTQITSAISTNFVTNGGEGAQTVSLRGLGAERTLVLLNGRRAGPAGVRGSIASFDLNTIPSSIVKSIEILKTGASSIYGSDAIAGVVNVLTKRDTDGIELSGFASVPTHGGAEATSISATYGKDFGRGHFLISADYFHQNDLKRRDRSFLDCSEDYLKFQTGERADILDVRTGQPACSGTLHNSIITRGENDFSFFFGLPGLVVPDDPLGGRQLFVLQYQQNNELEDAGCIQVNTILGVGAPDNLFGCNFDRLSTGVLNQYSELERASDVFSGLTRKTLYADASFEVNDHIELFTELLYNNRKTKTDSTQQISALQFTGGSPFPEFFPGLPSFGFCDPDFDFSCDPSDPGDPFNSEIQGQFLMLPVVLWASKSGTDIDYYRGVFGARGDFGDGFLKRFGWDIHGQYSKSDGTYFTDYARDDSLFTQEFRTRSCVGMTTPVAGLPCIDIDFTDPRVLAGNFTQAERDFLFDRDIGHTKYVQKSAEASLSGELFDLPAGPLGIAVGATIRRDSIKDTPGEGSLLNNRFNLSSSGITAGHTLTRELFGELSIPLVRNTPFIERLEVTAAGRITRVSAERRDGAEDKFGDETWKLGADWQVNDWLRFRGSWGTSFRAPALFELFLENETGFQSQQAIDLCSDRELKQQLDQISPLVFENCGLLGIPLDFEAATGGATVVSAGGLGILKPETSTAKTASIILTPSFSFLPDTRVSLAVDYFDIEVRNEIVQLGAANIVIGCLTSNDVLNEPLCDQITRVPEGDPDEFNIDEIANPYINISEQRNRGIDVTGRITHDLGGWGKLSFLAQMTWQLEDTQDVFGAGTSDVELNGEVGDPRWVGDFNLSWEKGPWTVIYGLDVIGSADNKEDYIASQGSALNVPGTLCRTSQFYPGPYGMFTDEEVAAGARVPICPDVSVGAVAYHSLSVTRRIQDKFEFTLGMANIFDRKPPRVTSSSAFGETSLLGQTPFFGSQYDLQGRRLFMQVRGRF